MADQLTFERGSLQIDVRSSEFSYMGYSEVITADGLTLPATSYWLPLEDNQTVDMVRFEITRHASLGLAPAADESAALTTSDDSRYDSLLRADNLVTRFGRRAVEVTGQIATGDGRYAELMVFPVSVDENGEIWFNEAINFFVGEDTIDVGALLPSLDGSIADRIDRVGRRQTAAASVLDFLIVTSSLLAESLTPLAEYKTETGYRTELALIEDIVASESGRDNAERLRNHLKRFYDDGGRYVLLAGDETVLPIRYAYHYNAYTQPDLSEQQICDLYFADLSGDWDTDGDGVWGERYQDNADLSPELLLGRLPINTPSEAAAYVANLIRYETDPGAGDPSYLNRAFFFSSDQMRDDGAGGQHAAIAEAYPAWIAVDTINGVEVSRGDDPAPYNLPGSELSPVFEPGFGFVNIVAHGRSDGFVVRSSDYNLWPKSYLFSSDQGGDHGSSSSLLSPDRPSFYYSLACDNGAFDMDQAPFDATSPNLVQSIVGTPGGAIGFVAYSRWGWISSSHLLQKSFFEALFGHPERPVVEAMYTSKAEFYYYRDLVYGQNYFGDPTLRVYTETPRRLAVDASAVDGHLSVTVTTDGASVSDCEILLSMAGELLGRYYTDGHGRVDIEMSLDSTTSYRIAAVMPGAIITRVSYSPGSVTAVDDDPVNELLPTSLALHQNYPNPFNPTTAISFELPQSTHVQLQILNLLGQAVATLLDENISAGQHQTEWNGRDYGGREVASGVYFYRLTAADRTLVRKMVLLR